MKKLIFTIALTATSFVVSAQTIVKKGDDGNYTYVAKPDSQNYTANGLYLIDNKGKKLTVYATRKGREFVFATSKKTGKEYRKYITLAK